MERGTLAEVSFGEWLKRRRRAAGWTQAQLAQQISCSTSALKKIEAEERHPSPQIVQRLAEIFGIPPNEQTAFLRFAHGDWNSAPGHEMEEAPWRPSDAQSVPAWYQKRWRETLPVPITRLIGREKEIEQIQNLLSSRDVARLVTLTGPGGVGKTSLAVQVAANLRDHYRHGIFFVDLSPLTDPELVLPTVLQTMGVKDEGRSRWQESLIHFLRDKHLLLILDNFEHLLEEASHVSAWLKACEQLQVLTTSREPLHLRGEKQIPLQPLAAPDRAQFSPAALLAQFPALQLLVERLQEAKPDFELTLENALVACELCIHLDGLPLAIELAAAQIRYLTLSEILARLEGHLPLPVIGARDLPDRQRTITSTIAWSYSLLDADAMILFRRLAVFAGGFDVPAAQAVAIETSHNLPASNVLPLLGQLVEKSLLVAEENSGSTRYRFLETIREFAYDRLVESEEENHVRASHLNYFRDLAREGGAQIRSPAQIEWIRRLNLELDNFRAAICWAQLSGTIEAGLDLASSLWLFWWMRGNYSEVKEWILSLLPDRSIPEIDLGLRARACATAGLMAYRLGDRSTFPLWEESIGCAKQIGPAGISVLAIGQTFYGGATFTMGGESHRAREIAEEAIRSARAAGDPWLIAIALITYGQILNRQGEYRDAASTFEQALQFVQESGDRGMLGTLHQEYASLTRSQGQYTLAHSHLEKALSIFVELDDPQSQIECLMRLGQIALAQNDPAQAWKAFNQCKQLWLDPGIHWGRYLISLGRVRLLQRELEEARPLLEEGLRHAKENNKLAALAGLLALSRLAIKEGKYQEAQGRLHETFNLVQRIGGPLEISMALEFLAAVTAAQKKPVEAAHLLGAAEALRESTGVPLLPVHRTDYEQTVATIHNQLSEKEFADEWAKGRAMTKEQAIAFALSRKR